MTKKLNYCVYCTKKVSPDKRDQKYCSVECRIAERRELMKTQTTPVLRSKGEV